MDFPMQSLVYQKDNGVGVEKFRAIPIALVGSLGFS